MNIKEILEKAQNITAAVNPALSAVIGLVNNFLPEDKKLDTINTTGRQVKAVIEQMPPETQALLLSKNIDLKISESKDWVEIQRTLAEVDKTNGSYRPRIALLMACCICGITAPLAWAMSWAIISNNSEVMTSIEDFHFVILAIIAPLVAIVDSYFGKRTRERIGRLQAATGRDISTMDGVFGSLAKTFGGRRSGGRKTD